MRQRGGLSFDFYSDFFLPKLLWGDFFCYCDESYFAYLSVRRIQKWER